MCQLCLYADSNLKRLEFIDSSRTSVIVMESVLIGTGVTFRIIDSNKLISSVSKLSNPFYSSSLHGSFTSEYSVFDKKLL